jgi:hypothetical protein
VDPWRSRTKRWSPEQVAHELTVRFGDQQRRLCPESIYQAIYDPDTALTGVAVGLLDDWLAGANAHSPEDLGHRVKLPSGHWFGERAATDILALARKGRAYRSLDTLLIRQGGKQVLYGSALALAAATRDWATSTGADVNQLSRAAIR